MMKRIAILTGAVCAFMPAALVFAQDENTELFVLNGDMYIFVFFFAIVIFLASFWVALKA